MANQGQSEHKLTLQEVLGLLVADSMISQTSADTLLAEQRLHRHHVHPLTTVTGQNWKIL